MFFFSLSVFLLLRSDFSFRFSPGILPGVHSSHHHVLNSHPAIVAQGPKQDIGQDLNHRYSRLVLVHFLHSFISIRKLPSLISVEQLQKWISENVAFEYEYTRQNMSYEYDEIRFDEDV